VAEYGSPLAVIDDMSDPLSYDDGTFTISTSDDSLIDEEVDYKLTVKFADY